MSLIIEKIKYVSIHILGPWWGDFTYIGTPACEVGMRVCVPFGTGHRIGLIVAVDVPEPDIPSNKVKKILALMDEKNVFSLGNWDLLKWMSDNWLCSLGSLIKIFFPKEFYDGEPLISATTESTSEFQPQDVFLYRTDDKERRDYYENIVSQANSSNNVLVVFPQHDAAKRFWDTLPAGVRKHGLLWPKIKNKKTWDLWNATRRGEFSFIIGAHLSALVPLPHLRCIVIEDEFSGAWRTISRPTLNLRSVLAKRARLLKTQLIMGGRMPSPRAYLSMNGPYPRGIPGDRITFIDLWDLKNSRACAIERPLPFSSAIVRETLKGLSQGAWSLWLLDRKGYAQEIVCGDCGGVVLCPDCTAPLAWADRRDLLFCRKCGHQEQIPESCPFCGGMLLHGAKPGLESLHKLTKKISGKGGAVIYLEEQGHSLLAVAKRLKEDYPQGGLILGTRLALGLLDYLDIAFVGWINADFEMMSTEFDARTKAFAMIWESAWRGFNVEERKILVQSRRAGKDWQMALKAGWSYFWRKELEERKEMDLPPYTPLVKINLSLKIREPVIDKLERNEFSFWVDENENCWIRTRNIKSLKEVLLPFFSIDWARKEKIWASVWFD